MLDHQALTQCDDYEHLNEFFMEMIENKKRVSEQLERCSAAINSQLGAAQRIVDHVCQYFVN
jgi:putative methionine-R-sulfoxide reductase with GAF domain